MAGNFLKSSVYCSVSHGELPMKINGGGNAKCKEQVILVTWRNVRPRLSQLPVDNLLAPMAVNSGNIC